MSGIAEAVGSARERAWGQGFPCVVLAARLDVILWRCKPSKGEVLRVPIAVSDRSAMRGSIASASRNGTGPGLVYSPQDDISRDMRQFSSDLFGPIRDSGGIRAVLRMFGPVTLG